MKSYYSLPVLRVSGGNTITITRFKRYEKSGGGDQYCM